jgi:RHS repeat-associated protein
VITKVPDFEESVAYDPNGNIQKYKRNGNNTFAGQPIGMDSLNYFYIPGTNQLDHITDSVSASYPGYNDLTTQAAGNYQYDSIGELTADAASGITNITWTVYGKVASITKSSDTTILFTYDAAGHRISKSVVYAGDTLTTWYVRDAQGNILSIYTYDDPSVNGKDLSQTELNLYGSSRLGIWQRKVDVAINTPATTDYLDSLGIADSLIFVRGNKLFELTNHLDNVLSTISDKRYGVSTDDSTVAYFNPEVVNANDYYPFGSLEPYRTYMEANASNYRFGFNGKEDDNEVKGVGDQIDYGKRMYDPRVGRFLSVDPMASKFAFYSPFQFASNNVISSTDIDGKESLINVTGKSDEPAQPVEKAGTARNVALIVASAEWQMLYGARNYIATKLVLPETKDLSANERNDIISSTVAEYTTYNFSEQIEKDNSGQSYLNKTISVDVDYDKLFGDKKSEMVEKLKAVFEVVKEAYDVYSDASGKGKKFGDVLKVTDATIKVQDDDGRKDLALDLIQSGSKVLVEKGIEFGAEKLAIGLAAGSAEAVSGTVVLTLTSTSTVDALTPQQLNEKAKEKSKEEFKKNVEGSLLFFFMYDNKVKTIVNKVNSPPATDHPEDTKAVETTLQNLDPTTTYHE